MRVIVTGATSFIGQAVIKELLSRKCKIFAVVRPDSPSAWALKEGGQPGLTLLSGTLEHIADLVQQPALKDGADAWLHLGWEGAGSANRQNPQLQARNIGYALEALQTAARLGCARFLFSGSQAEYGICSQPMSEELVCHPVSEYGKDKLKVCRMAADEAQRLGIEYVHARIFSVYGPGDHPWSLVSTCVDTFLKGGHMQLGPCTQQWNFLYITDAAAMLAKLLLGKGITGVYNVAGEDTRPLRAYIEELHKQCGGRGTYEFGCRPPNAEGVVSLMPELSRLKASGCFSQQVSFSQGIGQLLGRKGDKGMRR